MITHIITNRKIDGYGRNISEAKFPLYFASDLYNMLVVADKYQTGFDEPLLHILFVDKKLKDVKAVQTLSRLNRWQKDKKDTYVLDCCNKPEDIKKSFEPFYKGTEVIKPVDVNYVYTFRRIYRCSSSGLRATNRISMIC